MFGVRFTSCSPGTPYRRGGQNALTNVPQIAVNAIPIPNTVPEFRQYTPIQKVEPPINTDVAGKYPDNIYSLQSLDGGDLVFVYYDNLARADKIQIYDPATNIVKGYISAFPLRQATFAVSQDCFSACHNGLYTIWSRQNYKIVVQATYKKPTHLEDARRNLLKVESVDQNFYFCADASIDICNPFPLETQTLDLHKKCPFLAPDDCPLFLKKIGDKQLLILTTQGHGIVLNCETHALHQAFFLSNASPRNLSYDPATKRLALALVRPNSGSSTIVVEVREFDDTFHVSKHMESAPLTSDIQSLQWHNNFLWVGLKNGELMKWNPPEEMHLAMTQVPGQKQPMFYWCDEHLIIYSPNNKTLALGLSKNDQQKLNALIASLNDNNAQDNAKINAAVHALSARMKKDILLSLYFIRRKEKSKYQFTLSSDLEKIEKNNIIIKQIKNFHSPHWQNAPVKDKLDSINFLLKNFLLLATWEGRKYLKEEQKIKTDAH